MLRPQLPPCPLPPTPYPLTLPTPLRQRRAAQKLGLVHASALPKRAVQFGCGLSKLSNVYHFGSNTRAKKHHAGAARSPFAHQATASPVADVARRLEVLESTLRDSDRRIVALEGEVARLLAVRSEVAGPL